MTRTAKRARARSRSLCPTVLQHNEELEASPVGTTEHDFWSAVEKPSPPAEGLVDLNRCDLCCTCFYLIFKCLPLPCIVIACSVWPSDDHELLLREAERVTGWDGSRVYTTEEEAFPVYVGLVDGQFRQVIEVLDNVHKYQPEVIRVAEALLCQHMGIDLGQIFTSENIRARFQLVVDKVCTHDGRCGLVYCLAHLLVILFIMSIYFISITALLGLRSEHTERECGPSCGT